MLKICFCSDNHGDRSSIARILSDNPDCDYYLHAGDSLMEPEELEPFCSVEGNNDWGYDYPRQRLLEIGGHRILLIHGDGYSYSLNSFAVKARNNHADTVFFGHTHSFLDIFHNGIRFINPGSSFHNRDGSGPCYARVYIDDNGNIRVERIDL